MKEQKFKQGDLVRVLFGHPVWGGTNSPIDLAPYTVGKLAVIEGSYWDLYGYMFPQTKKNRDSHIDDYSIMFVDTGDSCAWKHTSQLELVSRADVFTFFKIKIRTLVLTRIVYPYSIWKSKYKLCFKIILFERKYLRNE